MDVLERSGVRGILQMQVAVQAAQDPMDNGAGYDLFARCAVQLTQFFDHAEIFLQLHRIRMHNGIIGVLRREHLVQICTLFGITP